MPKYQEGKEKKEQSKSEINSLDQSGWLLTEEELQDILEKWDSDLNSCNITSSLLHAVLVYYLNSGYGRFQA